LQRNDDSGAWAMLKKVSDVGFIKCTFIIIPILILSDFAMNEMIIPDTAHVFCPALWSDPCAYERDVFQQKLHSFIPSDAFDAHAHLWDCRNLAEAYGWSDEVQWTQNGVNVDVYRRRQNSWMGRKSPRNGLFFAVPARGINLDAANDFVYDAVGKHTESKKLLLIKPQNNPEEVEAKVLSQNWAGFKVYHCFAERPDTQNAYIGEYLPEWAWDIAHQHSLAIMLHQVRKRSLNDADNQKTITDMCRKYPNAKLILAHAARGFCGMDTVEGVYSITGLENVYFDTSAICEAAPLEAILRVFGSSRLLYGSDFGVSEVRGKAVSLGDGFHWIYEWSNQLWPLGQPILVGIESLLALHRACETTLQSGDDIENIFGRNARKMFVLQDP
jgi:glutamate-1-semialdehyde 2,1-aminomutase